MTVILDGRVAPFGNPRIKGYLHLAVAYRSLSRPSSPPRAKASAMRPSFGCSFVSVGILYTFYLVLKLLFAHNMSGTGFLCYSTTLLTSNRGSKQVLIH